MKTIRIATRASKLALIQSNYIRDLILQLHNDIKISIVNISTKGDRDKSDFLYKSTSVGVFTSEVENAILNNQGDIAVHSLKDLPTSITPGLVIAAIPTRENNADALVGSAGISSIADLPAGATVGTSSLRRIAQLRHIRNDLKYVPMRGNVETRVDKVISGEVDAIIIACAGLNRLGLSDKISVELNPNEFIPAPAQGALAVQIRTDDIELAELLTQIDDAHARIRTTSERKVMEVLHGGCSIPLGVHSEIKNDSITISAALSGVDGIKSIKSKKTSGLCDALICAEQIAAELLASGGKEILEQARNTNYQQPKN